MTVRDFVNSACRPERITVLVGTDEFEMLNINTYGLSRTLMDLLGDYVVEDFKANKPDEYCVWILERPVKANELQEAI